MLNIKQFISLTDVGRIKRSRYNAFRFKKKYRTAEHGTVFVYDVKSANNNGVYKVQVEYITGKTKKLFVNPYRQNVKVWCSCPDMMYRFEWVNWKTGAGYLIQALDLPPKITNPSYAPSLCKHLVKIVNNSASRAQREAVMDSLLPNRK